MLKWPLTVLSRVGALVLVGYIAWLAWQNLGPHKPQIGTVRQQFADKVIPAIVDDLRDASCDMHRVAILHFENDPTDYFTDHLRSACEQSSILDLYDRTIGEKFVGLIHIRQATYGSLDSALARGRDLKADAVVFGTIHAFKSHGGGTELDVEVCLAAVASGRAVFSKRYTANAAAESDTDSAAGFPWFQRVCGWLIAVLLLPVFTIAFIRTMVRKGSNKTNTFVLGIYTLADAILAWLLVGAALNSWVAAVVFVCAVVAALLYNVRIMTFALRLEET